MAKPKSKNSLTNDEERFVDEYLIDRNGTAAYIRAKPGTRRATACEMASRLLRKSNVKRAIELGQTAIRGRTRVTADRVVRQYARIAFADIGMAFDLTKSTPVLLAPRDIPFDTRQAITAIKLKRRVIKHDGEEDYEVEEWEYKFADKVSALDKLSKHLGLYQELPPLDQILMLLPEPVRETVRAALAQAVFTGSNSGGDQPDQSELPALEPNAGRDSAGPDVPNEGGGAQAGPVANATDHEPVTTDRGPLHSPGGEKPGGGGSGVGPLFD